MGIIPGPTEYGNNCALCFPAGETPKLLKAFFSGIQMGVNWQPVNGPPPNGYYDLHQTFGDPCVWKTTEPDFPFVTLTLANGRSSLKIVAVGVQSAFLSSVFDNCIFHYTNDLLCSLPNTFCGGHAYVTVPGDVTGEGDSPYHSLSSIITKTTPMIDPDPRMELFPIDDESFVVRYAGKRDATNIKIKFDTDLAYWYEHFG